MPKTYKGRDGTRRTEAAERRIKNQTQDVFEEISESGEAGSALAEIVIAMEERNLLRTFHQTTLEACGIRSDGSAVAVVQIGQRLLRIIVQEAVNRKV